MLSSVSEFVEEHFMTGGLAVAEAEEQITNTRYPAEDTIVVSHDWLDCLFARVRNGHAGLPQTIAVNFTRTGKY